MIIVGAGGFAKEVIFLIERNLNYKIKGIVDDNFGKISSNLFDYPILGSTKYLNQVNEITGIVISIANPKAKEKIYHNCKQNKNLFYPNIIDNSALVGKDVNFGFGNIIMPYTTFSASISIGNFNMINIHSTIGHDTEVKDFNSIYPSTNISGNSSIGYGNEFGVGTKVIQNIKVGNQNIIGAGSIIIRDIANKQKVVGNPAKTIESWD
ncbi:sialic acid O-acetyltransferase NeuD family sugar O-acyltransferase [Enterococcus casseliflavus EC20]|uniref:Sialic acid O-acetyltransferase NeuD family sugar O-acyltransferase n=1 Tax=Enterococcus casseliflavus EC20 TaxID=565655 RepID=C9A6V8_ENTCA|nr:acetyltransferase [Enterococcus casseliflavus]EEV38219.1 sialic acid O-acetyltransferase NeuD family sugar O-acyltransferase [Enterococcus casseliflavus EC20]